MSDYFIYKIYDDSDIEDDGENFYCCIVKEEYGSRVISTQKYLSTYKELFGNKKVDIVFIEKVKVDSIMSAKKYLKKYVKTNYDTLRMIKKDPHLPSHNVPKSKKIKKNISWSYALQKSIETGETKKSDISLLIEYNEERKRQIKDKCLYNRDNISVEDLEKYMKKFKLIDATKISKEKDLYYCEECAVFISWGNSERHRESIIHKENCKTIEPIWVD